MSRFTKDLKKLFLDEKFIYGFVSGFSVLTAYLFFYEKMFFRFMGIAQPSSILFISFLFVFAHHTLKRFDSLKRFVYSFCFCFFVMGIHDFFWSFTTYFTGWTTPFYEYIPINLMEMTVYLIRDSGYILVFYYFLKDLLKVNKEFLFFLSLQIIYYVYKVFFLVGKRDLIFLMYVVAVAPYLFTLKKDEEPLNVYLTYIGGILKNE